jgi:mycobactin lysine-N-oxygenase
MSQSSKNRPERFYMTGIATHHQFPQAHTSNSVYKKSYTKDTLLVVGAGPKAIAIAAKHTVLARLGLSVPRLVIIDAQGIASHWSGDFGFTDGKQLLGTRPEKDAGFPYASTCWGDPTINQAVVSEMLQLSWHSHLIATERYSEWVDRGRVRPTHYEWSQYLHWVAERVDMEIVHARVDTISCTEDHQKWQLSCTAADNGEPITLTGDGLVITGPGTPTIIPGQPTNHPRVFNGASFWQHTEEIVRAQNNTTRHLNIGIIGTGETAAAIVLSLINLLDAKASIEVVSPYGVIYSRDEGFQENRMFSDPDGRLARQTGKHQHELQWLKMTEKDRRAFMKRTDRGVFSVHAVENINHAENVRTVMGTAKKIHAENESVCVEIEYDDEIAYDHFDYVIVGIGFNALWFLNHMDAQTRTRLQQTLGGLGQQTIERSIGEDLAINDVQPRLHLPMLAGVAQGPGFPNLSCLGLLSDRVLSTYIKSDQCC